MKIIKQILCASLQSTVIDILMTKLRKAAKRFKYQRGCCWLEVSANTGLRDAFHDHAARYGWKILIPKFAFTTDNAAMVAITGYYKYMDKDFLQWIAAPFSNWFYKLSCYECRDYHHWRRAFDWSGCRYQFGLDWSGALNEGFRVVWRTTVGDNEQDMLDAFDAAMNRAQIVLVTGGIGPTKTILQNRHCVNIFSYPLTFSRSPMKI